MNPSESFIGVRTKNGIEWADYSDIITTVTSDNDELLNNGFCYDNFTLRAYTEPITEGDISAATGNTETGVADGELLDIITVSFKDALGIDGNINGCPYIGRDIYAVNTDSGVRFYKITAADIDTWRRTGKLNAAPVTMDEKLDGLRLVGNFSDKFLDRTDYILLYLKDYNFMDWDNQYRYIVRYNEESNSIEYVASGDVDEIRGVTESGYAYRYENVNSVCFIYITDLATGKVRRVSMDYSSLGEGYSPNFAIASYVEQDKIVFHQWDWNDIPTGLNKGALWSIDVTTGEIVRLEKHDTYIYNGNRENVFYLYNDGELGALRVYMHNTGEIYDVTELGYRIAGDGTAWMMSAIGSNFYGTTVVIEYCNEDQTQFAYALADIAENKLLTEIIPYEGRNGFTLGADGSLLIRNGDKWDLYRADGTLRARFDDISDVGDQPYVFVIDGSEGFFINEGNKRVSAAIDREGILGVAYTGGNGMYHAGLEDGSEVFVTWAQPKPAGSDENPATGTSGFAGMLAVMCVSGLAAAVVRKKK